MSLYNTVRTVSRGLKPTLVAEIYLLVGIVSSNVGRKVQYFMRPKANILCFRTTDNKVEIDYLNEENV